MKTVEIDVPENDHVYQLLIGQNQRENDAILKMVDQNDIWFHLENLSGPHFILRTGGDQIPKKYINQIAAMFSLYKTGLHRYTVIYTTRNNVRLTNTPGQVTTSNVKRIRI